MKTYADLNHECISKPPPERGNCCPNIHPLINTQLQLGVAPPELRENRFNGFPATDSTIGAGRQLLRPMLGIIFLGLMAMSAPSAFGETTFTGTVVAPKNANDFHIFLSTGSTGAHDPHAPPFTAVETKESDGGGTEISFSGGSVTAGTSVTFDFYNTSRKAPVIDRVTWTSNGTTIATFEGSRIRLSTSNWPTRLEIGLRLGGVQLSWPNEEPGLRLQATTSLTSPHWSLVPQPPVLLGDQLVVMQPLVAGMKFYRLVNTNPPALLSVTPYINGSGLTLTFSQPLNAPSATTNLNNYYLSDSQFVRLFPMQAFLSSPASVDLVIDRPLVPGEIYNLGVARVANIAGYMMAPVTLSFTNPIPDTIPPMLVSLQPDAAGDRLTLTFSEPVDEQSAINPLNYYLVDSQFNQMFPIQVLLSAPDSVELFINPPLAPNASYNLGIQGVRDLAGNVIWPVTFPFSMP